MLAEALHGGVGRHSSGDGPCRGSGADDHVSQFHRLQNTQVRIASSGIQNTRVSNMWKCFLDPVIEIKGFEIENLYLGGWIGFSVDALKICFFVWTYLPRSVLNYIQCR